MEDFTSADIDWKGPVKNGPAEGITLHVAVLSHPYINALRPYVPLFEELTGVEVAYDILPVEEFWVKTAADLAGGTGFYDLVMTGTEFEWGWDEAGWVYDLNEFIYDAAGVVITETVNAGLTDQALFRIVKGPNSNTGNGFLDVDNITITGTTVPEPSVALVAGWGLLLLGRRRRK